ncbi:MAG TPA: VOC family protein [Steroidobacteraceae bacterium]|nr:VOC family protein [Steroidobacteraceae bacterium]
MAVQLNHTIVPARDAKASAIYLADILGRARPTHDGPFYAVEVDNGVTLDFMTTGDGIRSHHYAFLVSEPEFDQIFGRIRERGAQYWADPGQHRAGEINRRDGGRGLYWEDPDGHLLEILTRPYGSGD